MKPARYSVGVPSVEERRVDQLDHDPTVLHGLGGVGDFRQLARRLSSVMHHTSHGKRDVRSEPSVSVATMMPNDSAKLLLARLYDKTHRAAS